MGQPFLEEAGYYSSATATFRNFQYNLVGEQSHALAGTYTTQVYDAGRSVAWDNLSWLETVPSGCELKLQLGVADSPEGPWTYLGPDGTPGSYFTSATGQAVPSSTVGRYCRVRAYLEGDGNVTPILERLELSYSGTVPSSYRTFAYDAAGNLTQKMVRDSSSEVFETRTYDNLNQIVDNEIDGGLATVIWTYTHDDNGNLTSKSDGTDTYEYTWDEQNRLVEVQLNSTTLVTYEYDEQSRLLQRVEGGTTTNLHWDGWDLVKEIKSGAINETTNYLVPFGEVLAFERGGDWYYLHGDPLSSTKLVTDENGDQVGRFIYGAWGEELYASESVPGILENRFVGGLGCRRDGATNLIYMRHRWYDPASQRFISRDPIGFAGGDNLYQYADGNPTNNVDEHGLEPALKLPPKPPAPRPNLRLVPPSTGPSVCTQVQGGLLLGGVLLAGGEFLNEVINATYAWNQANDAELNYQDTLDRYHRKIQAAKREDNYIIRELKAELGNPTREELCKELAARRCDPCTDEKTKSDIQWAEKHLDCRNIQKRDNKRRNKGKGGKK